MRREMPGWKIWLLVVMPFLAVLLILFLLQNILAKNSSTGGQLAANSAFQPNLIAQSNQDQGTTTTSNIALLNGHVPSLTWIYGRDCSSGVQEYLQNATTNPNAALVGTGWLDPTTGELINGENNNCVPGSLSMDSVVQLVHQHGGKVYLTITMETDGSATSWTTAQQTAYVVQATQTPGYITPILNEAKRVNYDGVIMDLEGTDSSYPNIQRIFTTYNQQVWHALQPLHKLYGIALIHKVSSHDAYYTLNGFEDWSLLSQSADFLVVMAVDQSYWTPGPSVSVPWLQQLLDYTMQTMPRMLPHIIWELPLYGDSWHQSNGQWVFDGTVDYQTATHTIDLVSRSQISQAQSSLQDPYQPHLVYTDSSGVINSLWFMSGTSLRNIMHDFQQLLRKEPQFARETLQFAIWWSTMAEPPDFWTKVDTLY